MDKDTIILGAILFIAILPRIYIFSKRSKFAHIMNHPEIIREMEKTDKIPLWLKIQVWFQYGRHVGHYLAENELKDRECQINIKQTLGADAMRNAYIKHNADPKALKDAEEYVDTLIRTYRALWVGMLWNNIKSSKSTMSDRWF